MVSGPRSFAVTRQRDSAPNSLAQHYAKKIEINLTTETVVEILSEAVSARDITPHGNEGQR